MLRILSSFFEGVGIKILLAFNVSSIKHEKVTQVLQKAVRVVDVYPVKSDLNSSSSLFVFQKGFMIRAQRCIVEIEHVMTCYAIYNTTQGQWKCFTRKLKKKTITQSKIEQIVKPICDTVRCQTASVDINSRLDLKIW